ncbi:MAG: GspE/PulE family protein [Patescibacteria group bacterium]|nr:GspE/PulE family protein [bacterium]MDZ4240910.1 GspE/PulE family protein [Patescibacteria group bacterium]
MGILEILARKNIIREEDIPAIRRKASTSGKPLEETLVDMGIPERDIIESKGEHLNIPVRFLGDEEIQTTVLEYIPEESASHYRFVPLGVSDGVLEVGMTDPDNIEARDALTFISTKINMPFKIFLISEEDFEKVLKMYKGLSKEVTEALDELEGELQGDEIAETAGTDTKKNATDEVQVTEDAPVTKIVATILRYATEGDTSDVHLEHTRDTVRVRFRVDGVLNTSLVLPKKVHSAVVARIKILANMRLDEKRKPQDGRFSAKIDGRQIDFRVSTFPTFYGEKVVMRILDQEKGVKKLTDLGLSKRNLETIRRAIKRPYGLILISGPTGSGKTTTLYAMLNEIDKETKNVLSLEDPIEYSIDGINQSQVHPEIGYTFANGLRTTLRQDPDIIMVGEIRDKETAQLAIQAALTGHLVLSTVHTNNAIGAIPRLIDMGVDPYLIGPTLVLAMAQRLVRMFCPGAGRPISVDGGIAMMMEKQFADLPEEYKKEIPFGKQMYGVAPAPGCPSGVRGRVAVMEMLEMDKELENAVLKNPTETEIWKIARKNGMMTMKEDAISKAFSRIIPFEEINGL